MSIVFSDNFNSGSLTGWGSPNNIVTVNKWGVDGTFCAACSSFGQQSRKTLATPIINQGSIRAQVACVLSAPVDSLDGANVFTAQDFNGGVGSNNFQLIVYLKPNGAFRIRMNHNLITQVFTDTASGLFPLDGTQFALQVRFTISGTSQVIFTVNNVDVATINETWTYAANRFDDVWITATLGGVPGALTSIVAIDNYEVDNSNVAVSWSNGNAPKLDLTRICLLDPLPPVAELSGIYFINPTNTHDIYNGPVDKKIPDPTVKSALLGE